MPPTSVTTMASSNISFITSRMSFGVMIGLGFMVSGCSAFQPAIAFCHSFVSQGSTYSSILSMASPASATMGMSTCTFREMADVSMSMCTIFAFGAKEWSFPVIRSLNLVPIENRRSHSFTAILQA